MTAPTGGDLPQPKFNINDVAYLRESAVLGHIEGYKVGSIAFSSTRELVYTVNVIGKAGKTQTFGDRITHKGSISSFDNTALRHLGHIITFFESELVSYCEALELARDTTAIRLAQLNSLLESACTEITNG